MKTGILAHVYHLETKGWEQLVWGDSSQDLLGTLPTLAWLVLTAPVDQPIEAITIGCGPSRKEGMSEAEYTKQFLIDRLEHLRDFSRLRPLLDNLSTAERQHFAQCMQQIIPMQLIARTRDEIAVAASMFADRNTQKVIQVCVASHAPRCVQVQATARLEGAIPKDQQWSVVASDTCFSGAAPADTLVLEPPHRGDDPMLDFRPTLAQTIKPLLYAPPDQKKELIRHIYAHAQHKGLVQKNSSQIQS